MGGDGVGMDGDLGMEPSAIASPGATVHQESCGSTAVLPDWRVKNAM